MFSKKYMFDIGQKTCTGLIEKGYVHTFEEILYLLNRYKKVKTEAERGLEKTMPKDFRKDLRILQHIEENLKVAEEATRKGSFEENYQARMKLGKYFQELEGYHWLAVHFYKSSQLDGFEVSVDVKLTITSLQRQAQLEETRGNVDISLRYLRKALKMARRSSLDDDDPLMRSLNENLCRVYQRLGCSYLERERDSDKLKSLKYFRKAADLAMAGEDLESRATCQALLGKAMLKFNNDDSALESFELYTELCEKSGDQYGVCQGHFAASQIFKRAGDWEKSVSALNKCRRLAKEHGFHVPLIFSAINFGQIETVKRNYTRAEEHFKEAYDTILGSDIDYPKKESLKKLTKVMFGIGKAHLTLHVLINALQTPMNLLLPKLLKWRQTGGSFTDKTADENDGCFNADEDEKEDKEAERLAVIGKLMEHEFNKE